MDAPNPTDWPVAIFNALRDYDVRQVYHVPDAGHAQLIRLCEAEPAVSRRRKEFLHGIRYIRLG